MSTESSRVGGHVPWSLEPIWRGSAAGLTATLRRSESDWERRSVTRRLEGILAGERHWKRHGRVRALICIASERTRPVPIRRVHRGGRVSGAHDRRYAFSRWDAAF